MTVNYFEVRAALRAHLLQVPNLPGDRAWEGRIFTPAVPNAWIRETLRPIDQNIASFGPPNLLREDGLYLIDCFYPVALDSSLKAVEEMADRVRSVFVAGTHISVSSGASYIECLRAVRAGIQPEADWLMVPVTISFQFHTT